LERPVRPIAGCSGRGPPCHQLVASPEPGRQSQNAPAPRPSHASGASERGQDGADWCC